MTAVSMVRDQWVRKYDGGTDGLDIYANADQRSLSTEHPHGEYKITVMTSGDMGRRLAGDMTAGETYRMAGLAEFNAKLAEIRDRLRSEGWALESSADEWP